jgi:hypothetical protein
VGRCGHIYIATNRIKLRYWAGCRKRHHASLQTPVESRDDGSPTYRTEGRCGSRNDHDGMGVWRCPANITMQNQVS